MSFSLSLVFIITVFVFWGMKVVLGNSYALDQPGARKIHGQPIPQIGGLIFGPYFLFTAWWLGLVPMWYILGGAISILLGTIDDNYHVPWQIKFIIQLALAVSLSILFWGRFDSITFYNYSFNVSEMSLLLIFLFWFIGIYNAVNLIDGLDGLASGFMLILCLGMGLFGSDTFATLNLILAIILIGFLIFNQRPAKLFMGDSGSLFLGFHTAVLPLLLIENSPGITSINMTPFILLVSYLVADTTRVFFTRLAAQKSPMTADTIHFHHLILQESGSYLSSIGAIFFVTSISVIGGVLSIYFELSLNVMLVHLALLLFFVLTPPVQTYVPIITKAVSPLYNWQRHEQLKAPFLYRSIFMVVLLLGLISSLSFYGNLTTLITWQNGLAVILLFIFILFNRKDKMVKYVIQLSLILLFSKLYWGTELGIISKLITILLFISFLVFTLEKRSGTNIRDFSTLDLLMIIITLGGVTLGLFGMPISIWFFLTMFSIWFGTSFLLSRTAYFSPD